MINLNNIKANTKRVLKKLAKKEMERRVANIRAGKVIRIGYAESTIKKRKQYGLQTRWVDLTGNDRYSRKGWRLLDSWKIVLLTRKKAVAVWTRQQAAQLYTYHVRRYGDIMHRAGLIK